MQAAVRVPGTQHFDNRVECKTELAQRQRGIDDGVLGTEVEVVEARQGRAPIAGVEEGHTRAHLEPIGEAPAHAEHWRVDLTGLREPPVADADARVAIASVRRARIVEPRPELAERGSGRTC